MKFPLMHWFWIKSSKTVSSGISFVESGYITFHLQVMTHIFVVYLDLNATLLTSKIVVTISNCSRRKRNNRWKDEMRLPALLHMICQLTLTFPFLLVKTTLCPSEHCLQIILLIQTCMLFLFMNFYAVSWSADWTMFLFFIETL